MQNTYLMAIQEDGQKLVMMDGTIWIINPDDIKNTSNWTPPCGILINEISIKSEYDYSITNLDEDIAVTAQKRR
ncbi:MAG: hypothetical protein KAI99_03560 [Cyclobacteriaceae bacterium]|nr:hypothetical protein [Cyclobacteriaceae bacterium]MCK5467552.1 hypothetical protein [Cyclobacteriaceae bacterium]